MAAAAAALLTMGCSGTCSGGTGIGGTVARRAAMLATRAAGAAGAAT